MKVFKSQIQEQIWCARVEPRKHTAITCSLDLLGDGCEKPKGPDIIGKAISEGRTAGRTGGACGRDCEGMERSWTCLCHITY